MVCINLPDTLCTMSFFPDLFVTQNLVLVCIFERCGEGRCEFHSGGLQTVECKLVLLNTSIDFIVNTAVVCNIIFIGQLIS